MTGSWADVPGHVTLAQAVTALSETPDGKPYAPMINRGTLQVGLYAPRARTPSSLTIRTRSTSS